MLDFYGRRWLIVRRLDSDGRIVRRTKQVLLFGYLLKEFEIFAHKF